LRDSFEKRLNPLLALLLLLCVARLWIISLRTSFWVDEMVTVFVVHQGPDHPSLAIAPQVSKSIYYAVARAADSLFGVSEAGYRLPSILAMALMLLLIARLAARLIHPHAAWFAVFGCLALKALNTEAADARPYALGMCVSAAALLFLVNWLDSNRWIPAAGFVVFGALLWRVHLLYWPIYLVFALYAIVRRVRGDTKVSWVTMGFIFTALAIALVPVAMEALPILHEAHTHVFVPAPTWIQLIYALKPSLLLAALAIAVVLNRLLRQRRPAGEPSTQTPEQSSTLASISPSAVCLILAWWLIQPLSLFVFSRLTGDSVFIPRYLSIALPGAAAAATLAAARFIPKSGSAPRWKYAALILGAGVLLFVGNWQHPWTPHAPSDWRNAARAVHALAGADTPVICPSPFIEAKSPVWTPDYPLPGFLYSYLSVYPTGGRQFLFPFETSPEADAYARQLTHQILTHALEARPSGRAQTRGRFLIYGGLGPAGYWRDWFLKQPELAGWRATSLGSFGDVLAVAFEPPVGPVP
jgi:Dolichyl-phosphate-mannose-protein mannosyltransferase